MAWIAFFTGMLLGAMAAIAWAVREEILWEDAQLKTRERAADRVITLLKVMTPAERRAAETVVYEIDRKIHFRAQHALQEHLASVAAKKKTEEA